MGSTEQSVGLDFRIALLFSSSCLDIRQNESRTEGEDKSGQPTREEGASLSGSECIYIYIIIGNLITYLVTPPSMLVLW